ncbi:MAG: hypothetical protein EOP45_09295, partial [Sphingobacteriaceae bacterium]
MYQIIDIAEKNSINNTGINADLLLSSFGKITDYAKISDDAIEVMTPLIENKYFREFHSCIIHMYWQNPSVLKRDRGMFDGQEKTKEVINNLKSRLSKNSDNDLISTIRYLSILYRSERDLNQNESQGEGVSHRESAYMLADLTMALIGRSSRQITVNILMQAGDYFCRSANKVGAIDIEQMADEQLALDIYMTAIVVSEKSTPDVALYAIMQVLKSIAGFKYNSESLVEIIQHIQARYIKIADIYPIFELPRSNIEFLTDGNQSLILMRRFLHQIMENQNNGKFGSSGHDRDIILYQAYEASLKGWYEEEHNPKQEQKLRLELMKELLAKDHWNFHDLDKNVQSPWVLVDRDSDGWMNASSLPLSSDPRVKRYTSIDGVEVNHKTGEIDFKLKEYNPRDPLSRRLFTSNDLSEMIERKTNFISFSLDPVDNDMHYHPFNKVWFKPDSLYQTQLLNTSLMADYILKFLTMGIEVQGKHPYKVRPIENMIFHLPEQLKKIIYDFHSSKQSDSIHRFWIESEELPVATRTKDQSDHITQIGFDHIRMVVKKHKMVLDKNNNLIDHEEKGEGWSYYRFDNIREFEDVKSKDKSFGSPSIIIEDIKNLYFFEDNNLSIPYTIEDESFIKHITQQKLDTDKKVIINSADTYYFYKFTKEITELVKREHNFSPEYVFAQEFTHHYDEFAESLPVFGQLRELSKACVAIQMLGGIRKGNKKSLAKLDEFLGIKDSMEQKRNNPAKNTNIRWDDLIKNTNYGWFGGIPKKWNGVNDDIISKAIEINKMHKGGKTISFIINSIREFKQNVNSVKNIYKENHIENNLLKERYNR